MKLYIVKDHIHGAAKFCTNNLKILNRNNFYEEIDLITTKEDLESFKIKEKIKHIKLILDEEDIELIKKYL